MQSKCDTRMGAHLTTSRRGYSHHGVYVGHGGVVHYSGSSGFWQCGPVEEVPCLDLPSVTRCGSSITRGRRIHPRRSSGALARVSAPFWTLTGPSEYRVSPLSARSRPALVVTGRLNKQIAGDIGVTENTVKEHRGQVMRKLGASSVLDLARMADNLNLTPRR